MKNAISRLGGVAFALVIVASSFGVAPQSVHALTQYAMQPYNMIGPGVVQYQMRPFYGAGGGYGGYNNCYSNCYGNGYNNNYNSNYYGSFGMSNYSGNSNYSLNAYYGQGGLSGYASYGYYGNGTSVYIGFGF